MDTIVTLDDLENMLNVRYPKKFRDIYESGAMEWMKHSYVWLNQNRQQVEKNVKSFFYGVVGDCEPIVFPEINNFIEHFEDMLGYDEEYRLGKIIVNPKYRFIPFAHMGSGDLYCFWYDDMNEEVRVVVYGHDTGDMTLWANNFDEFLLIQLCSSVIDWDCEFDDDTIQAHISFLKDEHKLIFESEDKAKIKAAIQSMGELKQIEYLIDK